MQTVNTYILKVNERKKEKSESKLPYSSMYCILTKSILVIMRKKMFRTFLILLEFCYLNLSLNTILCLFAGVCPSCFLTQGYCNNIHNITSLV